MSNNAFIPHSLMHHSKVVTALIDIWIQLLMRASIMSMLTKPIEFCIFLFDFSAAFEAAIVLLETLWILILFDTILGRFCVFSLSDWPWEGILDEEGRCAPKWQMVWLILHQLLVTSLPSKVMSRNKDEKQRESYLFIPFQSPSTQNPSRKPSFPFWVLGEKDTFLMDIH